jgi:hypothetical protein
VKHPIEYASFILFVSSFIKCPVSRYLFLVLFCSFSLSASLLDADTCSECCGVRMFSSLLCHICEFYRT